MRDILLNFEGSRIMPFRFDDAPIEGTLSLDGYIKIVSRTPQQVAGLILERLGLSNPYGTSNKKHRAFTSKLPTVNTLLVGREDELKFLDEAWANPATNFVQIIAPGGTGKTALMDKWFRRRLNEATVFGWSFYSQGVSTQHATSSDPFFAEIVSWLKIEPPSSPSVYAKAEAVANHLREERVLLILDGIEPLQNSDGVLQDPALKALLQELSNANQGLVLCTTRVKIDIPDEPLRAISLDLDNLKPESGAQYLRQLKVVGEEQELQNASQECGHHALAVTLLGTYLADFLDGDIRRRVEIRELMVDESKYGAHARRMMAAYVRMFAGKPEAAILRGLGFFNRPAEPEALKLVLPEMKELEYRAGLNRLFAARLILAKNHAEPVDCHPLIREHFAAVMRSHEVENFRQGHSRLYDHYCQKAAPYQPETLQEMTPLFYAVYHGCQAGQHQEVLDKVHWKRINRGDEGYLVHMLGAFGAYLSLLANFFEVPWSKPVAALLPNDQTWLLGDTGYTLRALGRLADALEPIQSASRAYASRKLWVNTATACHNVSELLLCLGHVQKAVLTARRAVDFADLSGDEFSKMITRACLADSLLQTGNFVEAQELFVQAEGMTQYSKLYSTAGYHFCELLLEQGNHTEVISYVMQILNWTREPLSIGVGHLSLGCAYLQGSPESVHHLNESVRFLRQSGQLDDLPRALLARGTFQDLQEVFRIATRSGMRLHLTDYHLASARLALKDGDSAKARDHFEQAEKLINETGYHRRDKELEQLRTKLG